MGPLLFLVYVNDFPKSLDYGIDKLLANGTNLTFSSCSLAALQDEMTKDLKEITTWPSANKLTLNVLETDFMVIGSKHRVVALEGNLTLRVNDAELQQVHPINCLVFNTDQHLGILKKVYNYRIEPYFTYCCIVWDSIGETQIEDHLQKLQNRAQRIVAGVSYLTRSICCS